MDRGEESSGQRKSLPEDPGGSDRDLVQTPSFAAAPGR